ncbi:hypothetical protein HY469_04550 [Candidatus Roizmanbacteria bacterium]|nr:hypothetical protein [Candidatus Roizmanbacteria bacterium]
MNFISDIPTIFQWYLPITLLGFLFLPLTRYLFSSFYDKGYIFSKILGILLIGYSVWLLGSLKLMPFTLNTILMVLGIWILVNFVILKKSKYEIRNTKYKLVLFEEFFFLAGLLYWSYIRGHEPSIHGLEKFMDFGFINSILNTSYFPPQDMWLAPAQNPEQYASGFFINYYYFGHYITGLLTKLTQLPSAITYNLMLATIFGFCLSGSFSIGFNLFAVAKKEFNRFSAIVSGLLAAFMVTLAGNLHTIYIFTRGYENDHPVPFWQIFRLSNQINYWYPNATRFIPNTIHEFPSYSWVVADLHGHVLDIPFVLLTLGVLFSFFISSVSNKASKLSWIHVGLLGFLTAALYMTNAWDGLIYLGLSVLVMLLIQAIRSSHTKKSTVPQMISQAIVHSILPTLIIASVFFVCTFPFNRYFVPFVHGIGVVGGYEMGQTLGFIKESAPGNQVAGSSTVVHMGPFLLEKGNNVSSPLWMMGVLWGFFYFNSAMLVLLLLRWGRTSIARLSTSPPAFFTLIRTMDPSVVFLLALLVISTGLLIVPEFFYAKDIYPGHYRANTMFKLGYQAFMMLSIVSAYTIIFLRNTIVKLKESGKRLVVFFLQALFIIDLAGLILIGIYPYFAIDAYYGAFKDKKLGGRSYEGLDGAQWLTVYHPDDYEAILWLKTNHPPTTGTSPVILEAVGESYTDYARISSYTGFPTVLGWPVHEWLWRGSYDEPGKRVEEVRKIYEGTDREEMQRLLNNFRVDYIIIGKLEREKYPNLNEELVTSFGKKVFESGETAVYRIN